MHDLQYISEHLYQLFQTAQVPQELEAGVVLRSAVDEDCCVQLRYQAQQQRWMLGVDSSASLGEAAQAQLRENLLRVAHQSRWGSQQLGYLDAEGRACLVDCDFLAAGAENVTAQAIEGRLQEMLKKLKELSSADADDAVHLGSKPVDAQAALADIHLWNKA